MNLLHLNLKLCLVCFCQNFKINVKCVEESSFSITTPQKKIKFPTRDQAMKILCFWSS